jgi:hypothetical protein
MQISNSIHIVVIRTKVPLGVVQAVNGNIKALRRRGRGYCDLNYLLLKAQRLAATRTQFIVFTEGPLKMRTSSDFLVQNQNFGFRLTIALSIPYTPAFRA